MSEALLDSGLAGKVALVTGGSGGLGQAISQELAAAGADVAIHYWRGADRAEGLAAELRARYPERRFPTVSGDIRSEEAVRAMVAFVVSELGGLDILVNNAGINVDRTLKKADMDLWRSVVDVNLVGQALVCHYAAQHLGPGGRIINVSSIIGATGNIGQTNYAAAKAGIIGLTKSLAKELGPKGITVNAVAPGFVDTPMTAAMPAEAKAHWAAKAALGRFGKPEEIAWCVYFLASPRASYVNGAVIHVNGGAY
jgi:3-oxoacyl-[acyl-carrier protein] reductase